MTRITIRLIGNSVGMTDQLIIEIRGYVPNERDGYADNAASVQGRECAQKTHGATLRVSSSYSSRYTRHRPWRCHHLVPHEEQLRDDT